MPQIRPGRVRTKRDNRREPLLLSRVNPQDINVREGEVKSIVCPDCQMWRRLMGDTKLKVREHCVSDKVADGKKHDRCPGSNQVVKLDIPVEQWSEAMLAADSTATGRRSARQHHKPLPAPAKPVAKMTSAPVNAADALTSYREHLKKCRVSKAADRCGGTHRCADGTRLAALYEQLQRTQPRRDRVQAVLARERTRFDRRYAMEAVEKTAAEWAKQHEATADTKKLAKRSGTVVEEASNACRIHPADTVSEFRGPGLPLQPLHTTLTHLLEERTMTTQVANIVCVHDIDWDLNWTPAGEPRTPWDQMSTEDADDRLALSRELGETLTEQEYVTADRDGQPLRIVLLITASEAHQDSDLGAVYEYTL